MTARTAAVPDVHAEPLIVAGVVPRSPRQQQRRVWCLAEEGACARVVLARERMSPAKCWSSAGHTCRLACWSSGGTAEQDRPRSLDLGAADDQQADRHGQEEPQRTAEGEVLPLLAGEAAVEERPLCVVVVNPRLQVGEPLLVRRQQAKQRRQD